MLKQFAPSAVTPPSPKNTAWIARATEIARMEAQGPSTIAATPIPTACPVVPPGNGKLNIITTKEKAANNEMSGNRRACRADSTRFSAIYQNGVAAAANVAQVEGLRYPSGICIAHRTCRDYRKHSTKVTIVRSIADAFISVLICLRRLPGLRR